MEFIKTIAPLIQLYAPQYGIKVHSPIIAQAILESASGTSDKVLLGQNYFGLKWRNGRCPISNEYFVAQTAEQNKNGSYVNITSKFCKFKNMEDCVIGYFQWINVPNYSNLKGVTDPKQYLNNIKADGYASSINYVQNLMNIIKKYDLTKYDTIAGTNNSTTEVPKYYRVQCGAFSKYDNARALQNQLKAKGFYCIIKKIENLYKCQVGAFSKKENAESCMKMVKEEGFNAFIIYN